MSRLSVPATSNGGAGGLRCWLVGHEISWADGSLVLVSRGARFGAYRMTWPGACSKVSGIPQIRFQSVNAISTGSGDRGLHRPLTSPKTSWLRQTRQTRNTIDTSQTSDVRPSAAATALRATMVWMKSRAYLSPRIQQTFGAVPPRSRPCSSSQRCLPAVVSCRRRRRGPRRQVGTSPPSRERVRMTSCSARRVPTRSSVGRWASLW